MSVRPCLRVFGHTHMRDAAIIRPNFRAGTNAESKNFSSHVNSFIYLARRITYFYDLS